MPAKSTHAVIIANDLRTGRSVYFTKANGWSESIREAELLESEGTDERLAIASRDEAGNLVIDPYVVGVSEDLQVADIRERIRASGPTILDKKYTAVSRAA